MDVHFSNWLEERLPSDGGSHTKCMACGERGSEMPVPFLTGCERITHFWLHHKCHTGFWDQIKAFYKEQAGNDRE